MATKRRLTALFDVPRVLTGSAIDSSERSYFRVDTPRTQGFTGFVRGQAQSLSNMQVTLDNDYGTWTAYSNEYWPAEYLIDKQGNVRRYSFGEGDYPADEAAIRSLLAGESDVVADIYKERVATRGYGSGAWGWLTAYRETIES